MGAELSGGLSPAPLHKAQKPCEVVKKKARRSEPLVIGGELFLVFPANANNDVSYGIVLGLHRSCDIPSTFSESSAALYLDCHRLGHNAGTPVTRLFLYSRPTAVLRAVPFEIISPFYLVSVWAWTHVAEERPKIIPSRINCDPACAVVYEVLVFRVAASPLHRIPHFVEGVRSSRTPVLGPHCAIGVAIFAEAPVVHIAHTERNHTHVTAVNFTCHSAIMGLLASNVKRRGFHTRLSSRPNQQRGA